MLVVWSNAESLNHTSEYGPFLSTTGVCLFSWNFQIRPVVHSRIVVSARWRRTTDESCTIKWVLILSWIQNYFLLCYAVIEIWYSFLFFFFNDGIISMSHVLLCFTVSLPTEKSWFLRLEYGFQSILSEAGRMF